MLCSAKKIPKILAFIMCFNTSFATVTQVVNRINEAIDLALPATNHALPIEVLELQKKMTAEIAKADYANALATAMRSLEKYPNNFLMPIQI